MSAKIWASAAGLLAALLVAGQPVAAGDVFKLASGRADTTSHAVGVGLSSLVKFELLPSTKIDLQIFTSTGAVDNVRLLQSGDVDFAILPSAIGHAARLGMGSFEGDAPATSFRAIATLWRDALHLVMREDDVASGTIDDLSRLKDRKVFFGEASTGMIDANRLLFADLGMDADQTFDLATVVDGDGMAAIKRGEVDAFSMTVRPPMSLFDSIFDDNASGLRLLDVTETQMTRANGNHWLWTPYKIPADTYPGQREDIWTLGLSNLLVVRADMDPEVVYAITESLFDNLDYLKRIDPSMADLSLDQALNGLTMPLHAGALRYYREVGLIAEPALNNLPANSTPTSPSTTPVKQDEPLPNSLPAERYPDADVAGEWPMGVGGPLEKAETNKTTSKRQQRITPATNRLHDDRDKKTKRSVPAWRRRATL